MPRSTRPVATVPRPVIENTSSTGIRNGLSDARSGVGMYESTASISSKMHWHSGVSFAFLPAVSASSASSADPLMIGISSPGKS